MAKTRKKMKRKKINKSLKSYVPRLNTHLTEETTLTKRKDFNECSNGYIKVKTNQENKTYKCLRLQNPRAKKQMLKLLNRKIVVKYVTAPKQKQSNCWFNTMFMCFFISDCGHKFTKILRQIMITGERLDKTKLDKNLIPIFLQLNASIQFSFDNVSDRHYLLKDTNVLIEGLAKYYPSTFDRQTNIYGVGEYGNPLVAYDLLFRYLLNGCNTNIDTENKMHLAQISTYEYQMLCQSKIVIEQEIIAVHLDMNENRISKKDTLEDKNGHKWKLDSMIISNEEHFICFLTINNKQYGFDGGSYSKLQKKLWKKHINTDRDFNLDKGKKSIQSWSFNFMKEYQILLYYRVK